jgi:hypothetical protein
MPGYFGQNVKRLLIILETNQTAVLAGLTAQQKLSTTVFASQPKAIFKNYSPCQIQLVVAAQKNVGHMVAMVAR